jgi:hypothetical protein
MRNPGPSKFILDCTCASRSIWFNKNQKNTIFTDIRTLPAGSDKYRPNFSVCPDHLMDYRDMDYSDESFNLVVWDPPHMKNLSKKSWISKRYGSLNAETWQHDIRKGFEECMRVLKQRGVLILKWSCPTGDNRSISLKEMLAVLPAEPLFGHTTGTKATTYWMCFMKLPDVDCSKTYNEVFK